jgi:hypothetical protein
MEQVDTVHTPLPGYFLHWECQERGSLRSRNFGVRNHIHGILRLGHPRLSALTLFLGFLLLRLTLEFDML